jgi:hypothetical protein
VEETVYVITVYVGPYVANAAGQVSASTTNNEGRVDNVAVARSVNMDDKNTNAKIVAGTVFVSMGVKGIIVKSAADLGYARMGRGRRLVESVAMDGAFVCMIESSKAVLCAS